MNQLKPWSLAILFVIASFGSLSAQSSPVPPAEWKLFVIQDSTDKSSSEVTFIFKAIIPEGHHVYATGYDCPNGGPLPSELKFNINDSYALIGNVRSVGAQEVYDDIFECNVIEFHHTGEFHQTLKFLKPNGVVSGVVEYQMCAPSGLCVLQRYEFSHTFSKKVASPKK